MRTDSNALLISGRRSEILIRRQIVAEKLVWAGGKLEVGN